MKAYEDNRDLAVLIVGGGPAGLTLANLLATLHIKFIIIERDPLGKRPSRATSLQPRLLDICQCLGIKDEIVNLASPLHGNCIYVDGRIINKISFYDPNTQSYSLSLDQEVIENILGNALKKKGVEVEIGKQLINLQKHDGRWKAEIVGTKSHIEHITTDIVVACDGGKSTVRKLANIAFPGETYPETAFICDCHIQSDLLPQHLHFFFSKTNRLVLVPLSATHYKVSGGIEAKPINGGRELITKMATELYSGKLNFEEVSNFRFYRIHARMADVFAKDNIFLCGDAAHLFPPNGGQGLNVAIEDAFILGELFKDYAINKRYDSLHSYVSRKIFIEERLDQVKVTKARYSYERLASQAMDTEKEEKRVIQEEL